MPVLFDSGVRSGSDVAKALALGATAVGLGRTYLYALAIGGVDGLVSQLRAVLAELDLLMAVDGFPSIARPPGSLCTTHLISYYLITSRTSGEFCCLAMCLRASDQQKVSLAVSRRPPGFAPS